MSEKLPEFLQSMRGALGRAALIIAVAMQFQVGPAVAQATGPAQPAPPIVSGDEDLSYVLGSGDHIKMTVYGEDDLSGDFQVDGNGLVRLPLIGPVRAGGTSVKDFETAVEAALSKGFLIDPRVSVEVTNYRPFTILGEVNKPGEYPYEAGMTVLNAVALAGGYTYRADQDTVYLRKKNQVHEVPVPADGRTSIGPGDTIRVDERIF